MILQTLEKIMSQKNEGDSFMSMMLVLLHPMQITKPFAKHRMGSWLQLFCCCFLGGVWLAGGFTPL